MTASAVAPAAISEEVRSLLAACRAKAANYAPKEVKFLRSVAQFGDRQPTPAQMAWLRDLAERERVDFDAVNRAAMPYLHVILKRWLPDGVVHGKEFVALNPRRADTRPGSFSVSLITGAWADFGFPQEEMDQFLEWENILLRSPTNGARITSVHAISQHRSAPCLSQPRRPQPSASCSQIIPPRPRCPFSHRGWRKTALFVSSQASFGRNSSRRKREGAIAFGGKVPALKGRRVRIGGTAEPAPTLPALKHGASDD